MVSEKGMKKGKEEVKKMLENEGWWLLYIDEGFFKID